MPITITSPDEDHINLQIWTWIRERWVALNPTVPIYQQNERHPATAIGQPSAAPPTGSWAKLKITPLKSKQAEIVARANGARRWRTFGIIRVEIRTPLGQGAAGAEGLAKSINKEIRDTTHSGLTFQGPIMASAREEDLYYYCEAQCEFFVDAIG